MQGQRFLYDNAGMISFFNMKFSSEIFAVFRKCLEGLSNSGVFHCKWHVKVFATLWSNK